jgi:Tfp pilus assembly protein PilN
MIEINLLPDELKLKTRRSSFEMDYLFYLIPLVLLLLVLIHLSLGVVQVSKIAKISGLNRRMLVLEPERKKIQGMIAFEQEPSRKVIEELSSKSVRWSGKLNGLSLHLPQGVWFNEISASKKELIIKGSVYSAEKREMDTINKFMSRLREDKDFMKKFGNMELGQLQTKTYGSYDVIDFVITVTLLPS